MYKHLSMALTYALVLGFLCQHYDTSAGNETEKDRLGPNAPEQNRKTLSKLLRTSATKELKGRNFSASGKEAIRIKKEVRINEEIKLLFGKSITFEKTIKIDEKIGDAEATATASFNDPANKLMISIPELRRKGDLEVRGKCLATCPFHGDLSAKVLGVQITIGFDAKAALSATADVKLVPAAGNKVKLTPQFVSWQGKVTDVTFKGKIANAILSKLANRLVNEWLEHNKEQLMEHANKSLQRAADDGKLTADPNDLFK